MEIKLLFLYLLPACLQVQAQWGFNNPLYKYIQQYIKVTITNSALGNQVTSEWQGEWTGAEWVIQALQCTICSPVSLVCHVTWAQRYHIFQGMGHNTRNNLLQLRHNKEISRMPDAMTHPHPRRCFPEWATNRHHSRPHYRPFLVPHIAELKAQFSTNSE